MGLEWYYQQNGQKRGPVSGTSLKQLAAAGKLQPTDLIWKEGMANSPLKIDLTGMVFWAAAM